VKAGKVLTNKFTFPMKLLLNGGDLEKSEVYPAMILWHVIYVNHESLCLPDQWKKSLWLT